MPAIAELMPRMYSAIAEELSSDSLYGGLTMVYHMQTGPEAGFRRRAPPAL